jgi:hypothetical protein
MKDSYEVAVGTKKCSVCGVCKPFCDFSKSKVDASGYHSYCKRCQSKHVKLCRDKNRDEYNKKQMEWRKNNPKAMKEYARCRKVVVDKMREEVIKGYGGVCVWCGERDPRALEIDHVNNDGAKERKEINKRLTYGRGLYGRLISAEFPPQYQLLCCSCNRVKCLYGGVLPKERFMLNGVVGAKIFSLSEMSALIEDE